MNRNTKLSALLLAAGLATAGTLAFAKANENDAVTDLAKAKISLSQAITAAEAHATGKAAKAELESEKGALHYEVEVVTADAKVFDVKVDAQNRPRQRQRRLLIEPEEWVKPTPRARNDHEQQ